MLGFEFSIHSSVFGATTVAQITYSHLDKVYCKFSLVEIDTFKHGSRPCNCDNDYWDSL